MWTDLKQKYPATLTLAIGGATIYLTLGVLLGALAARWRGSSADRLLVGSTLVVSSIPFYVIALLAWIYLSLQLQIFPNTGYYPITENPAKTVSYMMLPWLVIGLTSCTDYARFTRGQMVETLNEEYMRTAQAKGLPMRHRLFKHALRAAIVPVITIFGLDFATLLGGTIFTEQIFSIDGIGHWGLQALLDPDRHQRHQRDGAGRGGADRGREPARRRPLRVPRPARDGRLTAGTHLPEYAVTQPAVTPLSVVVSRLARLGFPQPDVRHNEVILPMTTTSPEPRPATRMRCSTATPQVRATTESLAAPLSPEDQTVQSMPDVSPTKWHRAHVTWFFETFVLADSEPGFEPFQDTYWFLFNSYYEAVGPRYARAERGVISRPGRPRRRRSTAATSTTGCATCSTGWTRAR